MSLPLITEVPPLLKEYFPSFNAPNAPVPKEAAAARKLFQFAKDLGLYAITTDVNRGADQDGTLYSNRFWLTAALAF